MAKAIQNWKEKKKKNNNSSDNIFCFKKEKGFENLD